MVARRRRRRREREYVLFLFLGIEVGEVNDGGVVCDPADERVPAENERGVVCTGVGGTTITAHTHTHIQHAHTAHTSGKSCGCG
jgi:hypothetical protein